MSWDWRRDWAPMPKIDRAHYIAFFQLRGDLTEWQEHEAKLTKTGVTLDRWMEMDADRKKFALQSIANLTAGA